TCVSRSPAAGNGTSASGDCSEYRLLILLLSVLWSGRHCVSQFLDYLLSRLSAFALRMAKAAGANAVLDIKDQIVARTWSHAERDCIQTEFVANLPGDHVIGASRVATHSETADQLAVMRVERQSAAKDDHSADGLSHHRIVGLSELCRR